MKKTMDNNWNMLTQRGNTALTIRFNKFCNNIDKCDTRFKKLDCIHGFFASVKKVSTIEFLHEIKDLDIRSKILMKIKLFCKENKIDIEDKQIDYLWSITDQEIYHKKLK